MGIFTTTNQARAFVDDDVMRCVNCETAMVRITEFDKRVVWCGRCGMIFTEDGIRSRWSIPDNVKAEIRSEGR